MTKTSLRRVVLAGSLVAALGLAACSNGDSGDGGDGNASNDSSDTTEVADSDSDSSDDDSNGGELDEIRIVTPRGSIDVMDDYWFSVAEKMGYFEEYGVDPIIEAGPTDATASSKFVAEGQADITFPSPGVIAASLDAGIPIIGIHNNAGGQIFHFAVPKDSDIKSISDLEGKSIGVADAGWSTIVDPMLVEAGVDLDSVEYVVAGDQYGQMTAMGHVDAGLGWNGMIAQWAAQGIDVDWVYGDEESLFPSNAFVVHKDDLDDPNKVDKWVRFLKAMNKALYFTTENPLAAAQLTYESLPDYAATVEPQQAVYSLLEAQESYTYNIQNGMDWGYFNPEGWQSFVDTLVSVEQLSSPLEMDDVFTNDLVEQAKDFDEDGAKADAADFDLSEDFAGLDGELPAR